jgi:hypothetical protein
VKVPVLSLAAGVLSVLSAVGDSITLHPIADTTLFSNNPTNNFGASTNLIGGETGNLSVGRALLRFDVAGQLPPNAVVQSATLTVTVVLIPPGPVASTFDLRRVLVDWTEGTGIGLVGSPAKPGEATWDDRVYPSMPWSMPGGAISNEFSEVVGASTLVGTGVGDFTFGPASNLVADVQQWLENPGTNFGWVLLSESESTPFTLRRFASREQTNASPSLFVQYIVPNAPQFQSIALNGGQIELSFDVQAGVAYSVEYKDGLDSGSWSTLTNLGPQTISTNVLITDSLNSDSQRFYRLNSSN